MPRLIILLTLSLFLIPACNGSATDIPVDGDTDEQADGDAGDNPDGDSEMETSMDGDVKPVDGDGDPTDGDMDSSDGDSADAEQEIEQEIEFSDAWADCRPNSAPFPVRPQPPEAATLPFLHVDGRDIVDDQDNPVMLRGVNFGSWLMMETWLSGIGLLFEWDLLGMIEEKAEEFGIAAFIEEMRDEYAFEWLVESRSHWEIVQDWRTWSYANVNEDDREALDRFWEWFDGEPWIFEERSLWKYLEARFGTEPYQELRETFQDAYITELDVQRVAELGLNLIRVPIWYEALETDRPGENAFKPETWQRLDRLVGWARKHGVYLMLDLHGAPGGQSTSWHQGLENGGFFWTTPACVDKTARLWKALATYFKDEPHIAVYDLLNEPMAAPDAESYGNVHDTLYKAVREADDSHIIMIEDGYKSAPSLKSPAELGWSNAMFSIHLYPGGGSESKYLANMDQELRDFGQHFDRFDCPVFLGEFNAADGNDGSPDMAAQAMDAVLARLNARGIHWGWWTWKYYNDSSIWGLYHPINDPGYRIDVKNQNFEKIKADFIQLDSQNFHAFPPFKEAVENNAGAAYQPVNFGELE